MTTSPLIRSATLGAAIGGFAIVLLAQTPGNPAFEAASIKPSKASDAVIGGLQVGSTEFRAMNIPLRVLIGQAYGIGQDSELIGGPAWLDTDRFDIVGKMARPDSPRLAMVRTLLVDRFKLATHKESKQLPIYALVVARSDGRLGPKMRPSTCVRGRPPEENGCFSKPGFGSFTGKGAALSFLIGASLSSEVHRQVVDRTGLSGTFDIDLHWLAGNPAGAPASGDGAVSIFTALQEQLGLKLESTTGPVDVLVIDHVEHPTED